MDAQTFADKLARIPNVVAVALGGSRATGTHRPDSDWDFGLYYRGAINADDVRALGYDGVVVEPGEWGRIVNGGAWLTIDGERVDILYRDLDFVEHWVREVEEGRYEVDNVAGQISGVPTYVLVGELATGRTLHGELPKPEFPQKLRKAAPRRWLGSAAFSLTQAEGYADRGNVTQCVGSLALATVCAAHGRLAERGEWALNEKRIVAQAGFEAMDSILRSPVDLVATVEKARNVLGLGKPPGLKFDTVER
ncbi:MAG: nucleotidyltransferase domain-containing protein [Chloroflexi bacterium]|nr:nucleotidyltransferase domain-containing protein [Chloroflexota bacterium]